jgi:hypothetical protein
LKYKFIKSFFYWLNNAFINLGGTPMEKSGAGFAGVPFAFQKKQTVRFAPALPIPAAKLSS